MDSKPVALCCEILTAVDSHISRDMCGLSQHVQNHIKDNNKILWKANL